MRSSSALAAFAGFLATHIVDRLRQWLSTVMVSLLVLLVQHVVALGQQHVLLVVVVVVGVVFVVVVVELITNLPDKTVKVMKMKRG